MRKETEIMFQDQIKVHDLVHISIGLHHLYFLFLTLFSYPNSYHSKAKYWKKEKKVGLGGTAYYLQSRWATREVEE